MRTLERALLDLGDPLDRISNDPLQFPHRYTDPLDQEIAGLIASGLAYGRVAAFAPRIAEILAHADAAGGPGAWVHDFEASREGWLAGFQYRWNRGADHAHLLTGLRQVVREHGTLGSLVEPKPGEDNLVPALSRLMGTIKRAVAQPSPSHGLRYLLVDPAGKSAAKRVHMFARWMVRPGPVDLHVWDHLDPATLLIPLDTHVHRISRLLGLTQRKSADRRAAVEVTRALARIDPADPVRFDFALAHLGISGGCRGKFHADVCPSCALHDLCMAAKL